MPLKDTDEQDHELENDDTLEESVKSLLEQRNSNGGSSVPPQSSEEPSPPPKPKGTSPEKAFPMWFVVLLTVFSSLLLISYMQKTRYKIPYSKMVELIKKQGNESDASGTAEDNEKRRETESEAFVIVEEDDDTSTVVKYSHLKKIEVTNYEIRATATRQKISGPKINEPQKEVPDCRIYCGRHGLAQDNGKLQAILDESGLDYSSDGYPSFFHEYAAMILLLAISIPLMIFILRRVGGSGAMAFGRNRSRLIAQEEIDMTFNDVAGVDEAVEELKEIVAFLRTPQKFQALGGRIPRGVLLVGPPGTGKTILAKAVAGEASAPFFSLSGSDFVELYVGVGAARVRDLFDQAARRNPCIIFIDELDALGKMRGSGPVGGHDERDQTLNALLVEMDGFSTTAGIIVMAATNRPEILDPALLRPGRFDRQVLVDRPDLHGREEILKVHVKKVKLHPDINLKEIASITSGFVGADLAALVNEAALLAARRDKDCVTMEEFTEGVERVTAGLEKKKRVIKPDEKRRVAVHESGHAIIAYFTPHADPVHKVSIIPRGLAALGYTLQRPEDDRYLMTKGELTARIQTLLAGTIAEELTFDDVSTGAQNDLARATDIARAMVMDFGMSRLGRVTFRENSRSGYLGDIPGLPPSRLHSEKTAWEIDQEIRSIVDSFFEQTRELLLAKKNILERLTERLLEKEVIESDELKEVIETA